MHLRAGVPHTIEIALGKISFIESHAVGSESWAVRFKSVENLVTLSRFQSFWMVGLLVVTFLAFGIGLFPARWLLGLYGQQIAVLPFSKVQGTVWHGQARWNMGSEHGPIQIGWHLSAAALWADIHGRVSWHASYSSGHLHFARLGNDSWRLQAVRASFPAQWLVRGGLRAHGQIHLDLTTVELRDAWPTRVQGRFRWVAAALQTGDKILVLGTVHGSIGMDSLGLLGGQVSNSGGMVSGHGRFRITPLGLAFNGKLRARDGVKVSFPLPGNITIDGTRQVRFGILPPDFPGFPISGSSQRAGGVQIRQ